MSAGCSLCRLIDEAGMAGAKPESGRLCAWIEGWALLTVDAYAVPGWCILAAPRHVEAFAELDAEEWAGFGRALARLDRAIRAELAPRKVYLASFGEQLPHWHALVAAVHGGPTGPSRTGPALIEGRADLVDPARSAVVAATLVRRLAADAR